MEKKYILGIDIGGTAGKAGLYDLHGQELLTEKAYFAPFSPHDGWLERDMDALTEAVFEMLRRIIDRAAIGPAEILGIGVTSYSNGVVLIDRDGRSPYNGRCILAGDTRAKELVQQWKADGTYDTVTAVTCQQLWAGQTSPLLAWMVRERPDVIENTWVVLSCADYIRYLLTGTVSAEVTNASTVSCMDLRRRCFSSEVFRALGMESVLPKMPERIVEPAEIAGYVTAEAAGRCGLCAGLPVMGGLADITSCCIASGITDASRLCVTFGTWSINEYISREPVLRPDLFMTSLYCIPGYYLITEGSTTSASNLQWYVERFLGREEERMRQQGKSVYDAAEEMIASIPYDDSSILFLPFLYGSNVNVDARSAFIGITGRHTAAHMLRAVYEGIAFSHLQHIEKLIDFRGGPPEAVRISGGGASSDEWCRMFADLLQLPVEISDASELGALGVAMCVTVGAGLYGSFEAAAEKLCRIRKTVQPDPARAGYYRAKYNAYQAVIRALDGAWSEFAVLEK